MSEVKETREVLDFSLSTAMTIDETLQDGFQWTDLFQYISPLSKLPKALVGIEKVPAELDQMDEEGRGELISFVKDLYNIKDDQAEEIVEQGIRTGIELGKLVMLLRKIRLEG